MPTPINAELYVSAFVATGTPGEYQIDAAIFNNQSDVTGNGAYDVQVGFVLYVPASSLATAAPINGVVHRYKFTAVAPVDTTPLSGTVLWDEGGVEEDMPTPGSACLLAEVTPNRKLGLVPADQLYFSMAPGSTVGALRVDTKTIHDVPQGGTGSGSAIHYEFSESLQWVVNHGKNTRSFVESLKDSNGDRFYASVRTVDANTFVVDLTEALSGSVDVVFG